MKFLFLIIEILILIGLVIPMYKNFFKETPHFGEIYRPIDEMIGFVANAFLIAVTIFIFFCTLYW